LRQRLKDVLAVAALVTLASAGVAFERLESAPRTRATTPAPPRFVARGTFCPPDIGAEGARTEVAVVSPGGDETPVRVDPGGSKDTLPPHGLLQRSAGESSGLSLTGFGARLGAGVWTSIDGRRGGAAAAPCSEIASDRWYFAEGSSELGADQRLLLYNPFLDEAVLRVVFHTAKGPTAKAALADVAIPPGKAVEVAVNDFVLREPLLATSVLVTRGQVVAWRALLPAGRETTGVQMSLGASRPATTWYFPYGALGPEDAESIALLNPGAEEAAVSITLATGTSVEQPPRLVELSVPPQSARRLSLEELVRPAEKATRVSAWVTSTNGAPVAAERVVTAMTGRTPVVTAETGIADPAHLWVLPPVVDSPREDRVELINPTSQNATVTLSLLREGGPPLTPGSLRQVPLRAGLRRSVAIERWTQGRSFAVAADRAIVAERWAYTPDFSDAAAAMGIPVRPSGPR
jgi:hypothetical protein